MGVSEVIILLLLIGCIICTMYYCYFHKMKRMQQALSPDPNVSAPFRSDQLSKLNFDGCLGIIWPLGKVVPMARTDRIALEPGFSTDWCGSDGSERCGYIGIGALGLDYRDQTHSRRFERDETRPNETEIYTITAGGFIIRQPGVDLRECTVVRRDSKIIDLPPSYEEVLRNTINSANSQTAQTAQTTQSSQTAHTTQSSQTAQTTSASQ